MNDGKTLYYDPKFESNAFVVHPGCYYTTSDANVMVVTILGSCVAACIRDPKMKIGGLNHFMLPSAPSNTLINSESNRYGSFAMEKLINEILKNGGKRENLEVKLFGGASIFNSSIKIGDINIDFIHDYIKKESLNVVSEDLGGTHARRILYWPVSGKALRLNITKDETKIVETEKKYRDEIVKSKTSGDIEIF
jgi:chemotaxis protein CheD